LDIERDSKYEFLEFVSLLVLVTSLAAFSIDIVLPALGVIGFDLSAHEANDTQKIILLIFVGMAVGQLFYGPLSDSIGRKHALSIGVGIFVVGCCFSLVAENFQQMLFGRLLQGL
jgi:DHA1 family bicyclomycin/chloramphenicol resistance-like MFS transporter